MQVDSRRWSAGTVTFGEQKFNRAQTPRLHRPEPPTGPPPEYSLFARLLRHSIAPRVPDYATYYEDAYKPPPRSILPALAVR